MTVKCEPCISQDIKDVIRTNTKDLVLVGILDAIPSCLNRSHIEVCLKPKRAPSVYQSFIKNCLATKPIKGKAFGVAAQYMKECAVEWRRKKSR